MQTKPEIDEKRRLVEKRDSGILPAHLFFFFRNGFSRMCQIGTFHKLENFVLKKDVAAQICPDVQGGIPFLRTAEFRQRLFAESEIVGPVPYPAGVALCRITSHTAGFLFLSCICAWFRFRRVAFLCDRKRAAQSRQIAEIGDLPRKNLPEQENGKEETAQRCQRQQQESQPGGEFLIQKFELFAVQAVSSFGYRRKFRRS